MQNCTVPNTPKRSNSYIVYNADAIECAITEDKKLSFKYFSLDYQAKRVYRNNGNRYTVNPIATVWNKDNYYLLSYIDKISDIRTYRIDRMTDVEIESGRREQRADIDKIDPEQYRTQAFSMYGGKLEQVGLRFTKSLIDEIFDKFGEQTRIDKIDENAYNANVSVQVSRTFFAWVVGTQGGMQIFSPQTVCEPFDKFVATIKERY